jgi:hypothetical protein
MKYKKCAKWRGKTRLKELMSVRGLKKLWEYFGNFLLYLKGKKILLE